MRVLIPIAILLIALTPTEAAPPSFSSDEQEDSAKVSNRNSAVYGEFIRTFTFAGQPQFPIVQPGGSLTFPMPTGTARRRNLCRRADASRLAGTTRHLFDVLGA